MNTNPNLINSPTEVIEQTEQMAVNKWQYTNSKLVLMGLLAGIYLSMGALLSLTIAYGMPNITAGNPAISKLLAGMTFPLGLLLIIIVGADLFTGNTANLIPAAMNKQIKWTYVAKNWSVVYLTNFIGAVTFVLFFVHIPGILSAEPWLSAIRHIAEMKCSLPWGHIFLKGIAANWLVCLAVWFGLSSRSMSGRILGIWFPVMAFVAIGYEHSIANMFYIPLGIMEGASVSWTDFLIKNLIPATLGNIVGGGVFVGFTYWYLYGQRKGK